MTAHGLECVICHVPAPNTGDPLVERQASQVALWNPPESNTSFQMFTTQAGNTGSLGGSSVLCLSCHDGVTAAEEYGGTRAAISGVPSSSILGADLRDDHPIGIEYPPRDRDGGHLRGYFPSPRGSLRLASVNGVQRVECTSCHDPHGSAHGMMLRESLSGSALCFGCHDM